ncbi:uncharacterized protein [Apostichopus japonicus]|uniref:uncharacterized protein n=1 Tax=Stichopus japonicus TaxID=307972 RepID=UPI003AB5FCAC
MVSQGGEKRPSYFDSASVETGVHMASSSSHSVKSRLQLFWLFAIVVCCMICVVARQQCQIYTIQRELNSLLELEDLSDELRDGDMFAENITGSLLGKLTADENNTLNAIVSRRRRQTRGSDVSAFAHLVGNGNIVGHSTFLWSDPDSSSNSYSSFGNVQLYKPNRNNAVRAIRVLCAGWYYVYTQIPYFYDSDRHLGHEIVRINSCGRSNPMTVLMTIVNLPNSPAASNNNWKYLGGIVYLAASSHVEVKPSDNDQPIDNYISSSNEARQTGAFFGLYLVKAMSPLDCAVRCNN